MVLDIARSHPQPSRPDHNSDFDSDPIVTWEALPDGYILPDDPVENIQQPALAAALTDALDAAHLITPNMIVAGNFALLATVKKKLVIKAPDWLLVPNAQPLPEGSIRKSYTPILQGDPVAIVMEFLSDEDGNELSLRRTYPYGKLYFYERILKVPTYVTFDPYESLLEVRQIQSNRRYALLEPDEQNRYWIPELDLFLGVWQGERLAQTADWLRWWDREGNLLLWHAEQSQQERDRAEQERQRADKERERADALAARLAALGIDPNAP
jgi:Uma2 family endonuclease